MFLYFFEVINCFEEQREAHKPRQQKNKSCHCIYSLVEAFVWCMGAELPYAPKLCGIREIRLLIICVFILFTPHETSVVPFL